MKAPSFMTSTQVFAAINELSPNAKTVFCDIILNHPGKWNPTDLWELIDAGLAHIDDYNNVQLGRKPQ